MAPWESVLQVTPGEFGVFLSSPVAGLCADFLSTVCSQLVYLPLLLGTKTSCTNAVTPWVKSSGARELTFISGKLKHSLNMKS